MFFEWFNRPSITPERNDIGLNRSASFALIWDCGWDQTSFKKFDRSRLPLAGRGAIAVFSTITLRWLRGLWTELIGFGMARGVGTEIRGSSP